MIRRLPPNTAHRDRWMVSYLDVVTILLVFFVAAAARTEALKRAEPAAKPAEAKPAEQVVKQPEPTAITVPQEPARPAAEAAVSPRDALAHKLTEAGIEVRREPRGLVASLPQALLFAPGDDRISGEARPLLARIGAILSDAPNAVIVVGHADSAPIHNRRFRSNWDLSLARGMRVLELMIAEYHIDERRLSVSGDGSVHPADTNDTPEGRAVNRRVELVILDTPAPAESPSAGITNLPPPAD